ncbi:MAG: PD40 domain-containing protein [Verrucomicrobiales bacterium]|nr:PD40 domain-containing protein [Verrucomicrobiales bacterium]
MIWLSRIRPRLVFLAILFLRPFSTPIDAATGSIFFNGAESSVAPITLRRVNADGTGLRIVPVALPEPAFPVVSRDGRRLLLTSGDPGRPFKLSRNIFSLDLTTGGINKVTGFEDSVRTGAGPLVTLTNGVAAQTNDASWTSYTIHFPYHKAFSPNGQQVAVMDLPRSGGSTLSVSRTNAATEQFLGGGRSPFLEVYPAAGPNPLGQLLFGGGIRTGNNQGGDGVDWHPQRAEVVGAFRDDIPVTGTSGVSGSEGTVIAVFATDGRLDPFLRKLTRPSGIWDSYVDIFTSILVRADENDYAPAISPDGTRVAYVRHTIRFDTRVSSLNNLPALCAIRVINYDGTGDREVLRLADGLWITRVAWSPDGTELAFDMAPQLFSQGAPLLSGDITRSEIHVVRADGSSPRRLVLAPAAYPTWSPLGEAPAPVPPTVGFRRDGTRFELRIDQLDPGSSFVVEGTTSLANSNWESLGAFTSGGSTHFITITPNTNAVNAFYRVRR